MTDLLTDDERRAIDKAAELWTLLCKVVGPGRTCSADLGELVVHIHAIQSAVMAQASARAYPELYRLLGGTIAETPPLHPTRRDLDKLEGP